MRRASVNASASVWEVSSGSSSRGRRRRRCRHAAAASRSTVSRPVPKRAITRQAGMPSISSASTRVLTWATTSAEASSAGSSSESDHVRAVPRSDLSLDVERLEQAVEARRRASEVRRRVGAGGELGRRLVQFESGIAVRRSEGCGCEPARSVACRGWRRAAERRPVRLARTWRTRFSVASSAGRGGELRGEVAVEDDEGNCWVGTGERDGGDPVDRAGAKSRRSATP